MNRNIATKYQVDVLLATLNGELFLEEFLQSLISQEDVKINLIVSDDGSWDRTLEILATYRKSFEKLTIQCGPQKGPSQNFLKLLHLSNSQYVAFADQDDIWQPRHLADAIKAISANPGKPQLFFSNVIEFQNNLPNYRIWPDVNWKPSLHKFFFQNYARGCTIVMNDVLVRKACEKSKIENIIMHDWWVTLIALTCGKVTFSNKPHIYYRLHNNNAVGNRRNKRLATIRDILKGQWRPYRQLVHLKEIHYLSMEHDMKEQIDELFNVFNSNLYDRIILLFRYKNRLREKFLDEIKLRIVLIIFPIFRNLKV